MAVHMMRHFLSATAILKRFHSTSRPYKWSKNRFKYGSASEAEAASDQSEAADSAPSDDHFTLPSGRLRAGERSYFSSKFVQKYKSKRQGQFGMEDRDDYMQPKSGVTGEILYGVHPVAAALLAKRRQIHCIYYKPSDSPSLNQILEMGSSSGSLMRQVDRRDLERFTGKSMVHQGVCADVSALPSESVSNCDVNGVDILMVLAGIHDPMNFGAALRSALFFGIRNILISKTGSCRMSPVVSKASSGALEFMDVWHADDVPAFLQRMKGCGWDVLGTAASDGNVSSINIWDYQPSSNSPLVLVIGNEGKGLDANILDCCTAILTIPPHGTLPAGMDSLNVSAAVSIFLHSLRTKKTSL